MTSYPPIQQKLNYAFDYPVHFTGNVFDSGNPLLARTIDRLEENRIHRAMVFVDSNVADLLPQLSQHILNYFEAYGNDIELAEEPRVLPGGEALKTDFDVVQPIVSAMINAHLCRHSCAIVVGGGAVIDTVGFAAAITHRGLRTINVPTTLSGQITAGICIRTGVNYDGHKNGVGSFAPPFAVINDHEFLSSLPEREWAGGLAEALRLALILDGKFFDQLCDSGQEVLTRDPEATTQLIHRSTALYLHELAREGNPWRASGGGALDFGHWASHKLETLSAHEVTFSEAVAFGTLLDSRYAVEKGWLPEATFERLHTTLTRFGVPLWFPELEQAGPDGNPELFYGLPDFQEHKGGTLSIPFPTGAGKYRLESEIDLEVMETALSHLKALAVAAV